MNEDGMIKVICKYHEGVDTCKDLYNKEFNCSDLYCDNSRIMNVTWTYYLINIRHLIEVKDE